MNRNEVTSSELASAALVVPGQPEDEPESLDTLGYDNTVQVTEYSQMPV